MRRTASLVLLAVLLAACIAWWMSRTRTGLAEVDVRSAMPAVAEEPTAIAALDATPPVSSASTRATAEEPAAEPHPPNPARVIVLSGTVRDFASADDPTGSPARDATVRAGIDFKWGHEARTDSEGRFRIELASRGESAFVARLVAVGNETVRTATSDVKLVAGASEAHNIVLARYPNGVLTGVTVDVEDRPVAGVRITFPSQPTAPEIVSDELGAFTIPGFQSAWTGMNRGLEVERAGYALVEARIPAKAERGAWEPMRIVLAAIGRLRVIVVDAREQPMAGIAVTATVSPIEAFGPKRRETEFLTSRDRPQAVTDTHGVAVLEDLWVDQRLEIELEIAEWYGSQPLRATRARDDVLVLDDRGGGSAIAIRAGEDRTLHAVIPAVVRVSGRVIDESGAVATGIQVKVEHADADRRGKRPLAESIVDDDGRFAFAITVGEAMPEVLVSAAPLRLGPPGRRISRIVDASHPASELVLAFEPALSIRGRVTTEDGRDFEGFVDAFATATGSADERPHFGAVSTDGSFAIDGLASGSYDLRARPKQRWAESGLRAVPAGSSDVELRLDHERAARVTIEATLGDEGEIDELVVLHGRIESRRRSSRPRELPAESTYSALEGWHPSLSATFRGSSGVSDALGRGVLHGTVQHERSETYVLDEGDYWFGARGRDASGTLLFPIGTGLVHVSNGDHVVRFTLTRAVPLSGRVRATNALDLAVGIAPRGGNLLELDMGHGKPVRARELGANGHFSFVAVPVGNFDILVGEPDELVAGRWISRAPLSVRAGMDALIELDLGR